MLTPVYFPGLNTLRFYAATCVVLTHLADQVTGHPILTTLLSWVTWDAQTAVNFFFVLSGFLITYLLLAERAAQGTIHLRAFYVRRALRILPLYYLIVFVGFFLLPWLFGINYPLSNLSGTQILLAIFLLPNFASLSAPLAHLWSIGVEEQYYIAWPLAARSTSLLLRVIFGIVFLKVVLVITAALLPALGIEQLLLDLRFECMAWGGLAAWLYIENHSVLKWFYHPFAQALALVIVVAFMVLDIPLSLPSEFVSVFGFVILILNVATNKRTWFKIQHPVFEALGKISYGIYMYHFPVIFLVYFFLVSTHFFPDSWFNLLLYLLSLTATLGISFVSYRWFERPFLNQQARFGGTRKPQIAPPPAT